MMTAKQMPKP